MLPSLIYFMYRFYSSRSWSYVTALSLHLCLWPDITHTFANFCGLSLDVLTLMCHLQPKMTPQERLKLKMAKALNKQSKADKKAAQVKIQQQEHKRQEREGELRAMARKIRMKERERREKERDEWERQYGRQSHSPSPSKHGREHSSYRRRSRSRSRSPYYRYWSVNNMNTSHRTLCTVLLHRYLNKKASTWNYEVMDWWLLYL